MRVGHRKDQATIRCLKLSALQPSSSLKKRGSGNEANIWSCLCEQAYIKIPMVWISESFWVSEHIHIPGGWHTPTPWGQKHLLLRLHPPRLNPMGLFTWLFVLTMLGSVSQMPRYPGLCADLQALQVGLICLLSSEFPITSVIWKWTWWIHLCVFYGVLSSGRCVSVIYLVCLLRICWALWLPWVPAWGT